MLGRGLLLIPRRAGGGVGGGRWGRTRGPPTGAVWATRLARAARRSARARRGSAMDTTGDHTRTAEEKIPVHPYLARQMSDFGFRQTLEVRTLGCEQRLRFQPICTPPPRKDQSKRKNSIRDTGFILVRATVVV